MLIRAVLIGDSERVDSVLPPVIVETEMLMLWRLLGRLSDSELALFLEESDALAERWSQQCRAPVLQANWTQRLPAVYHQIAGR
jgi:hypothetical protein